MKLLPMTDVVGDNWSHKRIYELSMMLRARANALRCCCPSFAVIGDWDSVAGALEAAAVQIKALEKRVRGITA